MSRSFNGPPKKPPQAVLHFCPECRKKYKVEQKLIQHLEKDHYYATRGNKMAFIPFYSEPWISIPTVENDIRIQIYDLARNYIQFLYSIKDLNPDCLEDATVGELNTARNLLPQFYDQEVSREDLDRITKAQRVFAKRLFSFDLTGCDWGEVMRDLESFFNLGLPYYDTNFCPTLLIDFFWHSTMQNKDLYNNICNKCSGKQIPHCIVERTKEEDLKRYNYFIEVFNHRYRRAPYRLPETGSASAASAAAAFSGSEPSNSIDVIVHNIDLFKQVVINHLNERIDIMNKYKTEEKKRKESEELYFSDFCKNAEINIDPFKWITYKHFYEKGYNFKFRGETLVLFVEEQIRLYPLRDNSTC